MAMEYGQGYGVGAEERRHRLPAGLRAPLTARAWREFGYLMLSLPISVTMFCFAITMTSVGVGLLITFLGIPVLAATLAACRGFGALERARARGLLGLRIDEPEPLRVRKGGFMGWMGAVLKSGSSWRQLLYGLLHFPWAVFAFCVALTFWTYGWALLTYPLWFWATRMTAGSDGIQFYSDETATPIEDGAVDWAETSAPYVTVARLTVGEQPAEGAARDSFAAEVEQATFDPWQALAAHRPLGGIMRARKHAYFASQKTRGAVS